MVLVRRAGPDDAEGLARVQTTAWREAYTGLLDEYFLAGREVSPDVWRQRFSEPDPRIGVFVATDAGRVIGFASAGPRLDASGHAESGQQAVGQLYALYVLAPFYGRAVGHRLHQAAVDELVRNGFTSAVLWVLTGNQRATTFYLRQGWVDEGVVRQEGLEGQILDEHRYSLSNLGGHE